MRGSVFIKSLLWFLVVSMLVSSHLLAKEKGSDLKGKIKVDGSSTVFPITEAMAEEFQKANQKVFVTVGVSGTGGGFKKFCVGEIDISNASRPITPTEIQLAKSNSIEYIEIPIAYDGISVSVNPKNKFVSSLTISQLRAIWAPDSKIKYWRDLNKEWPKRRINLYGPGPDSGTFDYFTETVVGKAKSSRSDYTASEDDNVLVRGISQDVDALGYFGYAYFVENQQQLKSVAIDAGTKAILPTDATITERSYSLSRLIFIYVSKKAADRREVSRFVEFYLDNAAKLVPQIGYVALTKQLYDQAKDDFSKRRTGSRFAEQRSGNIHAEKIAGH